MKRRQQKDASRLAGIVILLFLAVFLGCGQILAQDQPPSSTPTPSRPDQQQDTSNPGTQQTPDENPPKPAGTGTIPAGRSAIGTSSLRWGPLSLASFDTVYVYDSNFLFSEQNPQTAQGAALRAVIEFYLKRRGSEFSLRYSPYIIFLNGTTESNLASNSLNLDTYKRLTPRWTIGVNDQFLTSPSQGRLSEFTFTPNFSTGQVNQSPFLATGEKLLQNNLQLTTDYAMGGHDHIGIPVRYQYVRLTQDPNSIPPPSGPLVQENNIIGVGLEWLHNWGRENTLVAAYSYDRQYFFQTLGTAQFHSAMVSYKRQLRSTVRIQLGAGPSFLIPAGSSQPNSPLSNTITYQASAALFKSFRESDLSFSWSRSHEFTGTLTDFYNDRFDAYYMHHFSRRLVTTIGGGYIRQYFKASPTLKGAAAWGEMQYLLNPNWSAVASYMYLDTTGGGLTSSAVRNLLTVGVRGSWARPGR